MKKFPFCIINEEISIISNKKIHRTKYSKHNYKENTINTLED